MSAKTIWKGMVNVGLLNVPIRLYKATDDRESDTKTNYVHDKCKNQTSQKNWCTHCNEEVPWPNIARGVPNGDGSFTVLTSDELKTIKVPTSDALVIEQFVPDAEVSNPLWIECIYYATPGDVRVAKDGYATLVDGLKQTGRAAQGLLSLYGSEHPVALRSIDGYLVVQVMRTSALVRDASELPGYIAPGAVKTTKANVDLAVQLIKSMLGTYDPTDYEDAYTLEFHKLVEAKRKGQPIAASAAVTAVAPSADLMAALRASLNANAASASAATAVAKKVRKDVEPKGKSSKKSKAVA